MSLTTAQQALLDDIKGQGIVEIHGKDIRVARQLESKGLVFVDHEYVGRSYFRPGTKVITVEHMGDLHDRIENYALEDEAARQAVLIGSSEESR